MFFNKTTQREQSRIKDLQAQIERLEDDRTRLKDELEDVKLQKKIEEEDIKHMIRMSEERKDIELQKHKMELDAKQAEAIAQVKDEYRDKTEAQLAKQVEDMKSMYNEILGRLPNYNVRHTIKEGEKGS